MPYLARMTDQDLLKGVTAVAATLCILLLSLPGLKAFLSRYWILRGYNAVDGHYEDEDGVATEESIKAYSDLRPRIAVWLSLIIGLGASISSRVLALRRVPPVKAEDNVWTFIVAWSGPVAWVTALIFPKKHSLISSLTLPLGSALSSSRVPPSQAPVSAQIPTHRLRPAFLPCPRVHHCLEGCLPGIRRFDVPRDSDEVIQHLVTCSASCSSCSRVFLRPLSSSAKRV